MPEQLLNVLKLCLLVLLYLFFIRVARAVWVEVNGPRLRSGSDKSRAAVTAGAVTGSLPASPTAAPSRRNSRKSPRRSAKAMLASPGLVVLAPPEELGRRYELSDELTMGRAAGCHITLDDTYVSQVHARVFVRDGGIYIEDLGSTNGTYLNRNKVSGPLLLSAGDQVQVGSTVLELVA